MIRTWGRVDDRRLFGTENSAKLDMAAREGRLPRSWLFACTAASA